MCGAGDGHTCFAKGQAGPDLVVSQAVLTTPSASGNGLLRVTVTNAGTASASSFLVVGGVSDPANLNSIGGVGASCAKGRNAVYTCALPGLLPGATSDLLLSAKAGQGTSFTSNARLSGGGDTNTGNNSSLIAVPILPASPDVQISGSASKGSPDANAQFDYRFQVRVAGNASAADVVFSDSLPPEVAFVSAGTSSRPCSVESGVVKCALGLMPAGTQIAVTVTVLAPSNPGVTISNTGAAFASDGRDVQPGNNTVGVSVTTR